MQVVREGNRKMVKNLKTSRECCQGREDIKLADCTKNNYESKHNRNKTKEETKNKRSENING